MCYNNLVTPNAGCYVAYLSIRLLNRKEGASNMMYLIIATLAVLCIVLFITNDRQIKKAVLGIGGIVIAGAFFMHYFKLVMIAGPVLQLGISAAAVIVLLVFTVISFIKK